MAFGDTRCMEFQKSSLWYWPLPGGRKSEGTTVG